MKKRKRRKILLGLVISIILAITAIIISLSSTQAIFTNKSTSNMKNNYNTGVLSITALSKTNKISLGNTLPISDTLGIAQDPYVFTIKNTGNVDYQFDVQLLSTVVNTFDPQYIKIKIDNDAVTTLSSLTDSKIKTNLTLGAGQTLDISIRLWLDENTPNSQIGKTFESELVVNGIAISPSTNYEPTSAASYITNLYKNNQGHDKIVVQNNDIDYNYATYESLMNDRLGGITKDYDAGNIRYYGANPNNYILFNCLDYSNPSTTTCEKWRIIGVFDNMLKIIRDESIGNFSWDTSEIDVNNGSGINQWGQSTYTDGTTVYDGADLMKLLNPGYDNNSIEVDGEQVNVNNSLYWNRTTGNVNYFTGVNNAYKTSNNIFSNVGITDETKKYIADVTWYLESGGSIYYSNTLYQRARKPLAVINYADNVIRNNTWTGKVALMNLSDYGYATDFANCDLPVFQYNAAGDENDYPCYSNDWLYINGTQWTLSNYLTSATPTLVWRLNPMGYYSNTGALNNFSVRPTLFLNSDVKIVLGIGSEANPYIIK